MEPRLIQQQSQKLILSPQIRQYLRLLQLPLTQLEQAVEAEMAENPVLEERQADTDHVQEEPLPSAEALPSEPRKNSEEVRVGESFDHLDQVEDSFENTYDYPDFSRRDRRDLEEQKNFQDGLLTKTEGLSDFLLWQMRFLDLSEPEKKIATEIIGNIDEDGYLRASVEEIAQACRADIPVVEKVLVKIQELDPPGIAARTLQEALILQLQKKIRESGTPAKKNGHPNGTHPNGHSPSSNSPGLALRIVQDYLSLLEKRDWHGLAKSLSASEEEIRTAAGVIAGLEPRPGRIFYPEESLSVRPDATVSFNDESDGEKFKIEIHDESVPEVRINPYYRRLLRSKNMDEKGRAFLKEKMQSALNFLRALKLRKSTLREITEEIVKVQPEFFEKGFLHLKPLRLKDIAQNLGIHESTVSRAIQAKYIATPQGMIPYKSFFSVKLESSNGVEESQKSIMEKIKLLLEKEDPQSPLSDQQIVQTLKNEGIRIARRTVAKYRELLKILPSHMRRKK